MPLTLRRGRVTAMLERTEGLVRIEVDGVPCVAYPRLTGPVALGDDVVVNLQARELGLGSGGFHIVVVNLTRGLDLPSEPGAHVMTLPYTPLQAAVRHVEEEAPLAESLDGAPVVCCSLHSQVAPVCAALVGRRVAYIQLAGAALPVALSDTVRELRRRALLEVAVAAGPCLDAEFQAVNVYSALAWAKARGCEAMVCAVGPGIVGTGTALGHGGVAAAQAANAASALGGRPVLAVRASEAEERERHRGVSHHTRTALDLSLGDVSVAWPAGRPAPAWLERAQEVDASRWREACRDLPLLAHGPGPGRGLPLLRGRVRGGRPGRVLQRTGGAAFRRRQPLNCSVEAITRRQSGARAGTTRSSMAASAWRASRSPSSVSSSGSTASRAIQ